MNLSLIPLAGFAKKPPGKEHSQILPIDTSAHNDCAHLAGTKPLVETAAQNLTYL